MIAKPSPASARIRFAADATAPDAQPAPAINGVLPGIALCLAVTAAGMGLEHVETLLFGRAWLESLVLAILLGSAVRSFWRPSRRFTAGINFSAKTLLELAVVLLGASVSARAIAGEGAALIAAIVAVVVLAIGVSYGIGRALRLPHRMALLIACGNSICGNSAIAAVAPVIGADSKEVAGAIAFTAVLGVAAVLGLPVLMSLWGMSATQYGVFAGLTVYAVPQVLAATASAGLLAVQVGTLVKLVRVLMLGPVILMLAVIPAPACASTQRLQRPPLSQLVPWFIVGFLLLMALRTFGLVPAVLDQPAAHLATLLTTVSMAALGLGVDVRSVARAGPRVTAAVVLSLTMLGLFSYGAIMLLAVA
ncbi:YeiH family putative sulfate export transporter [Oxalobacteraceae bacterium CAVE-383]|nr:YeiH family putative sulfate export transporter [Oxalobacteraceae bacterium CAVE-383]